MTLHFMPVLPADPIAAAQDCLQRPSLACEPDAARSVAARTRAWAEQLRQVQQAISSGLQRDVWAGRAAEEFAARLHGIAGDVSATSERYAAYATALEDYARELDAVLPGLNRSRLRLCYELDQARSAVGQALFVPAHIPAPGGPNAPLQLVDRSGAAAAAGAASEAALRAAVGEFIARYGQAVAVADRCSTRLIAADRADLGRDRTGWRAFSHSLAGVARYVAPITSVVLDPSAATFSDALSVLGAGLTVVGLGLLFVCPAAGAACLIAAAVVSAVQLAVDSYRRFGQHDRRVGTFDLAMDLLGAMPVGGAAVRGGRAAAVAGRTARSAATGPVLERGASILIDAGRAGTRECHAGLTAEMRLLRTLPANYFRAPLRQHGGVAGLARRWAPKVWDAAGVPFSWPTSSSSGHLPEQQNMSQSTRSRREVSPAGSITARPR